MRLLPAHWSWPSGRRVYAGAAAALLAAVVAVVLVVPRGGGGTEEVIAEDPTPTATVTPTATATPTPSASPTAAPSASAAAPDRTPTATPPSSSTATPTPQLDAAHLLSAAFVDRAFGDGAQGRAADWDGGFAAVLACWPKEYGRDWQLPVTRTWTWPGEVVVGETLARLPSVAEAREGLADCRGTGPDWTATGAATRTLDVGDESYLAVRAYELYTQLHAGARVGRDLVLLHWRQPGRVADPAPLERALLAAVERVLGRTESAPLAGTPPRPASGLAGFLGTSQVIAAARTVPWAGTSWRSDTRSAEDVPCLRPDVRLAVQGPVYERRWLGGVMNAMDFNEVRELVAHAVDVATAERDFAACREAASGNDVGAGFAPVPDLGDEAFRTEWEDLDGSTVTVYVRQGSTYLVLTNRNTGDAVAVARAALATYAARGGLTAGSS